MAENSLFAILLRSRWWISFAIAAALATAAMALLPEAYRVVGAISGLPFVVIGVIAAIRQWRAPSAAQVAQTHAAISAMAWPAFAKALEDAFIRDGYGVTPGGAAPVDFILERKGRTMIVSARRWKSARIGVEVLRTLQTARDAAEAQDALCICLGELTDSARPFAAEHRIAIWQTGELAKALRGIALAASSKR
ncbi:MAG: restriction endonuclease [Burkholderiaceae bacterium]|nr:restriction endonuclease [Burkholderiaceae bacterium]